MTILTSDSGVVEQIAGRGTALIVAGADYEQTVIQPIRDRMAEIHAIVAWIVQEQNVVVRDKMWREPYHDAVDAFFDDQREQ